MQSFERAENAAAASVIVAAAMSIWQKATDCQYIVDGLQGIEPPVSRSSMAQMADIRLLRRLSMPEHVLRVSKVPGHLLMVVAGDRGLDAKQSRSRGMHLACVHIHVVNPVNWGRNAEGDADLRTQPAWLCSNPGCGNSMFEPWVRELCPNPGFEHTVPEPRVRT